MKKFLLFIGAALMAAGAVRAEEKKEFKIPSPYPGKICILLTDVGTIDTVAKTEEWLQKIKQFNIENTPQLTAADRSADPSFARQEVIIRFNDQMARYNEQQREVAAQNRRMEAVLHQLRTQILVNKNTRDVVVAKNYLQAALMPYRQYIQLIDRANSSISEVEKAIGGNDQQDVASASYFLTVIMQDLNEESNTVQVGNTMVKRTVYTQRATFNLRDFNGNVIYAGNVKASRNFRQTSASRNSGHNAAPELMEETMKQIAKQLGEELLSELTVNCVGKGEDFDPEDAVIYVDDEEFDNGSSVTCGPHRIRVEMDGYKVWEKNIVIKAGRKSMRTKAKLIPVAKAAPAAAPAQ